VQTRVLPEGEDVAELARASTADVLGMAGGDGSLAPVVEVALERDGAFVCIPFGTRNHFARDLGLARDDPIGALRAFDTGSERRIDVGRADERLFPNNVSLGVCARPVHRREVHRRRRDPPESVGARFAVDAAAGRLEAAVDVEPDVLETPVEFRVEPRALRVLVPAAQSGRQDLRVMREREL